MINLYHTILYEPLYNLLIFLYNTIPGHSIGLAIIGLTIFIKIILLPLSFYSLKSQKALQELQPKMQKLKKEHKGDKEGLAKATMELYKSNKVNPMSSCFPMLIQFPFLIAVYQVFRVGLVNGGTELLYPFVANPGTIDTMFLGLFNLAVPSFALAIITGGFQYIQTKMLMTKKSPKKTEGAKDENMMAAMNKNMQYFMPIMTIFIGMSLPSGLILYWLITTILTIGQQKILFKQKKEVATEKPNLSS